MANQSDLDSLVEDLSAENMAEYSRGGLDAVTLLPTVVSKSHSFFALKIGGELMAGFGVRNDTEEEARSFGVDPTGGQIGRVWLAVTKHAQKHAISLARQSVKICDIMLDHYLSLYSLVDQEHNRSVRWLYWLGFEKKGEVDVDGRIMFLLEKRRR